MLHKITDKLYVDLDDILWISKDGKEISISFKSTTAIAKIPRLQKEGKQFLMSLDWYVGANTEDWQWKKINESK